MFSKKIYIVFLGVVALLLAYFHGFSQQNTPDSLVLEQSKVLAMDTILDVKKDSIPMNTIDTVKTDSVTSEYLKAPVNYQSVDSIVVELDKQIMRMYKQGQVQYEQQEIKADYMELDIRNNLITAKYALDTAEHEVGYPVLKDGKAEYEARELFYNIKSKKAIVKDILTQEGEGYIQSKVSKRVDEDTFFLKDGKYTTCDLHDNPHYFIKLRRAKMIKDDKVITGWANLVLEGIPTPLGVPFGLFPLKKKYSSGIIMPSFGEERNRGFFLRDFGYYLAVNDHFDFRGNATIYTNGSWEVGGNTTYKKRYKYNGRINVTYGINKFGDKGLDDYRKMTDFSIRWTHSQDSKAHPYRTFSASVNLSSSQNDYNNAQSISNIVNTTKQSSISYSRRWADSPFNLSVAMQHSQNRRDTSISLTLPNVSFSMQTQYPFRPKTRVGQLKWYDKISVGYSANISNRIKTHEDKLLKSDLSRDWKNGFQHAIPISTSYKLARDLTFSANVNYKGVAYLNSIRKSYDAVEDRVVVDTLDGFNYAHNFTAGTSVSFTPKIFGMYSFKKDAKINAIRHVMSPSVSFSYTPDFGFNDDKYFKSYNKNLNDEEVIYNVLEGGLYGFPQKGAKGGYVNFSLDNNLEMKVRNDRDTTSNEEFKKIKLIESFRISTSYNIFMDSLNLSNISLSGRTSVFDNKVNIQANGTIDPYKLDQNGNRINKIDLGLGRLTSFGFSLGTSFRGGDKKEKKGDKDRDKGEEDDVTGGDDVFKDKGDIETFGDIGEYVDFEVPWSLNIDYNFRYSKPRFKSNTSQNLRVTGDVSLTEKWKVSFNTGYDFTRKEVTTTSFSIFRDLHCWEMSFSAIPFGRRQSFSFRIAVKSSLLKDLKLQKQDSWYDNF